MRPHTRRPRIAADHRPPRPLGLPLWGLIGLALLAVPRVVLHDLGVISEGTIVNALFVFVPILIWIVVALWARVPNAFLTLLVVGIVYGIFLAAGHQIFWTAQFDGQPPRLGGRLSDLEPGISSIVVRVFAVFSSIITGAVVGAAAGLLAWLLGLGLRRRSRQLSPEASPQE